MTYTIGSNCNLILTHADVNSGDPYGFLISEEKAGLPVISVQRELDSDGSITIKIYVSILLADNARNPDGSVHSDTKAQMYARAVEYLALDSGITLESFFGVFSDVGALGIAATEVHTPNFSTIIMQLTNAGTYWPPVDSATLNASIWDGALTWATSYWR